MKFLKDMAERVASTYLQALIGLLLAAPAFSLDIGFLKATAIAAIPAALSALKAMLAMKFGNPDSASFVRDV